MPKKATSPEIAKIASKLLRNRRSSKGVKKTAGSALSQREKRRQYIKRRLGR